MRRPERSSAELHLGVVVSRLSGSSGLTEMHNTFARRHALAEVAGAFPGGGTVPAVEAATDRYLTDPSVRELDAAIGHEARFTTESLLMCERAIVDGAERRRNEQTATLPADAVARAIDRHQPVLNDGQAAAIHALTRAGQSPAARRWQGPARGVQRSPFAYAHSVADSPPPPLSPRV